MNKPSRLTTGHATPPKRPTNVSLSADLVAEAKRLGLNISQICEESLNREVRKALGEEWKRENREAMESWNIWVDANGLPLAEYRQF